MTKAYQIRCPQCNWVRVITQNDVSNTEHTPESKAAKIQARVAQKCPQCDNPSLAKSPKQ